ncbi:MAG: DUF1080 domain-containing protein [Verrucomicrobiota bacterium]
MNKNYLLALASTLILASCATSQNNSADGDFVTLFDGKTLTGWTSSGTNESGYLVKDEVLISPKENSGNLFSEKEYSDFILRLDFKLTPGANNGIGIRAPRSDGEIAYLGNEIQVLDDSSPEYADLKYGQNCGSLYRIFAAKRGAVKSPGEWNHYEITAIGRHIKVVLNGKKVVDGNVNDVRDAEMLRRHPGMLRSRGHIAFLGHKSEVEFRNIRIKEMTRFFERDNAAPPDFTALFNGRDLTNWKGLVADPVKRAKMSPEERAREQAKADELMRQNWTVENGQLAYHGKGFDNLCSAKDFGDFELLVDWKIGPKGDSGIYLRGSPQVQIWEPNSGGVDPKHLGSGGLYNNQKNQNFASKFADHYPGEWNRFRILMIGEKVHVFLNNELVVNNVTMENYWDRMQPIFPLGAIELQAHHDPVYFKNVYVREISRTEPKKKRP